MALLVPGQGSQVPGMLTPWLGLSGASALLDVWSEAADLDLAWLGTAADADEIKGTAVAQPLLTATSLLSARAADLSDVGVICGHSVGEIAALAVAGVLEPAVAVGLAAARGRAMALASAQRPTGLAAVLGGDPDDVHKAVTGLGLELATVNVGGQVVVGGAQELLDALTAAPPPGSRVRPLAAAGAFHTSVMLSAVPAMRALVDALSPADAQIPVVANADGALLSSGRELVDRLVTQLTGPVRFDRCLETLASCKPTTVIELAPAGTLTAMGKRALSATFTTPAQGLFV